MATLFWFVLLMAGEVAAIRIVEAGHALHYQHYLPLDRIWTASPAALSMLFLQLGIVLAAFTRKWRAIHLWISRRFSAWRIVVILGVFAIGSTVPSRSASGYVSELILATGIQLLNLATVGLLAASIPEHKLAGLVQRLRLSASANRLALICAVWVVALSAILNVVSYQRHPHIADEVTYMYQAKYMAAGMLSMPRPAVPEAFDLDLMMLDRERWYSPVPPGWPAILAAGFWLGVPWLVNPVLAGLNILLAYRFLGALYGQTTAAIAVVLLALSPWNIFLAMSFMTHTATMTAALAAGVLFQAAARTRRSAYAFLGGAAIGLAALIRPLDGAVLAAVFGGWCLYRGMKSLPVMAAATVGGLLLGGLNFPYNKAITGDWLRSPIMAYTDKYYGPKTNALGFGPERGLGWPLDPFPGHAPKDAAVNALLNTAAINTELFGWGTGSLLFIAIAACSGSLRRSDFLMIGAVFAVVGAYSLYWFSGGPDFGARYWYLLLVPCVALSLRGIESIASARMVPVVACLSLISALVFIPWRASDKYRSYLGMTPDILRLIQTRHLDGSLVLIQGERFPDYESAAIYNPLDLHGAGTLYAWDKNPDARAKVIAAYPDRPVWLVAGPTITRAKYQLVQLLSPGGGSARALPQ